MRSPTVVLAVLVAVLSGSADARLSVGVVESDPRHPASPTISTQGPPKTRVRRSFSVDPSKATNNLAASATATQSVGVADGAESTADHFGQYEDLSDHSCPNN